MCLSR
jgi:putative transposase